MAYLENKVVQHKKILKIMRKKKFSEQDQKDIFFNQLLLILYGGIDTLTKVIMNEIDYRALTKLGGIDGIKRMMETCKYAYEIHNNINPENTEDDDKVQIVFNSNLRKGMDLVTKALSGEDVKERSKKLTENKE